MRKYKRLDHLARHVRSRKLALWTRTQSRTTVDVLVTSCCAASRLPGRIPRYPDETISMPNMQQGLRQNVSKNSCRMTSFY